VSGPGRAIMRRVIHEGVTVDALQALLTHDSAFTRTFGFQVQSIEPGVCSLLVPFNPLFERPGGIVSGQVYMTAADVAMWLAIKTRRGLDDSSVTVSMHTSFVQSARKEPITCTARVLRLGARLCHGSAECFAQSGLLLTHHALTYMRPEPKTKTANAS
jgi:acyl-coenzyme A thioesterase PaaI-like protein